MLRIFLILVFSLGFSQFAAADIASDIANDVKTRTATQNAKDANLTAEVAVLELIKAGVNPVDAVLAIRDVYGLTPEQTDKVISAAINSLPAGTNTKQLVALYSTQGGQRLLVGQIGKQGIGGSGGSGGGTLVSPEPSVSPN